jgi:hypothetical protein
MSSSRLLTPEFVLQQFDRLRSEVLEAINQGEIVCNRLGQVGQPARHDFSLARERVSLTNLSLVVLGAEGAGKSTLIRGMLGQELSPIEHDRPGTVAPVYFEYGAGDEPAFIVEFSEKTKAPAECDKAGFFDYVQQKTNEDNVKKVLRGVVKINHPLLANGLVLVDMPGARGVSDEVRAEAQQFIQRQVSAIVGVAYNRDYAPLLDIARDLAVHGRSVDVQAIISNRFSDYFSQPDGSGMTLPDDAVAAKIASSSTEARTMIAKRFKEFGLDCTLPEDGVFVFSAHVLFYPNHPVATPAHKAEIERFRNHIARYMSDNGVGPAIMEAARRCDEALTRLRNPIDFRVDLLDKVLKGDRGLLTLVMSSARRALQSIWIESAYSDARLKGLANDAWRDFKDALARRRSQSLQKMVAVIRKLEQAPEDTPSQAIKDEVARLQRELETQADESSDKFYDIVSEAYNALLKDANAVLARTVDDWPIFASHGAVAIEITPDDIIRLGRPSIEEGSSRNIIKIVGASGGAVVGGAAGVKLALVLIAIPDPTFTTQGIGIVVGASAVAAAALWEAADWLYSQVVGNVREVAVRKLNKARDDMLADEITERHPLRHQLTTAIENAGRLVNKALLERLEHIETLIRQPGQERDNIDRERKLLLEGRASLDSQEQCLNAIRREARSLSGGL